MFILCVSQDAKLKESTSKNKLRERQKNKSKRKRKIKSAWLCSKWAGGVNCTHADRVTSNISGALPISL